MSTEISAEEGTALRSLAEENTAQKAVAEQLQRVYEHVLNGRRPEAVGATERLAEQLDMELERPGRFHGQADR
jgi:hypothetical protein